MEIGRRIYFDLSTGEIIFDKGEMQGAVIRTDIENDIENYTVLSERNRGTYDFVEYPYGHLREDFMMASRYKINISTREPEFVYDDSGSSEPIFESVPLTHRVESLEGESLSTMMALSEFYEASATDYTKREEAELIAEQESVNSMIALTEAYELILQLQADVEELKAKVLDEKVT